MGNSCTIAQLVISLVFARLLRSDLSAAIYGALQGKGRDDLTVARVATPISSMRARHRHFGATVKWEGAKIAFFVRLVPRITAELILWIR